MSGCHSPYVMGSVAFNIPTFGAVGGAGCMCQCPCHLSTWMGIYPPQCYCKCRITTTQNNNPPTILYLENKKMEEKIKFLQDRVSILEMREISQPKKPYKCPNCDGVGINCVIGEIRGLPIKAEKCHSCEGKGIVWG